MSYLVIYVRDNPLFDRLTFTIFIFKDINNEYVFLVYPNLLISESTISALSIKYDKEPQRAMRDSTTNVENDSNFLSKQMFLQSPSSVLVLTVLYSKKKLPPQGLAFQFTYSAIHFQTYSHCSCATT